MPPPYYRTFYGIPIHLTARDANHRHRFADDQEDKRRRTVGQLQQERARLKEERAAKVTEMNELVAQTAGLEGEIRALDILLTRVNGEIAMEVEK
jgi:phage host-nuclease inhibitor protein Gam